MSSRIYAIRLERIKAEKARRSLREFVHQAWPILECEKFKNNWHIDAICEHLEAVTKGQIKNLVINVPPGHMKSLSVCVFWPSWKWIDNPSLKWIFGTYSGSFSIRDSIKTRELILSEWYQRNYGESFKLKRKHERHLSNDKFGFRIATSVDGIGTGERCHVVVHDDLLRANDKYSDAMMAKAIRHLEAMSTRAVNPEFFHQVMIMQRLNEGDPTGWTENKSGWERFILPMEFEVNRRCITSLGFKDPRKEKDELIWPERFPHDVVAQLKESLGTYGTAAELQQRPAPAEGGIIKLGWWKFYKLIKNSFGVITEPRFDFIYQSWDTAFKEGRENDYSVCLTIGYCNMGFCLIDRWKGKIDFPGLLNIAKSLASKYRPNKIGIEDAASGQSLFQSMKKSTDLPIEPIRVDRDKITRLHAVSPYVESGRVFLPEGEEWVADFMHQLSVFPNGKHDDDVDSFTQALSRLILYRSEVKQIRGSMLGR